MSPCRITTYVNTSTDINKPVRHMIYRRVYGIKSYYDEQLFSGKIHANKRIITVYRHCLDETWTSIQEEAAGIGERRIQHDEQH